MIKSISIAAIVSVAMASGAWAAPVSPATTQPAASVSSDLIEIGKKGKGWKKGWKKGKGKYRGRKHYRGGYSAGRKYGRAPHGWRSYSYRPRGWQRRGCIVVGPAWFCP